MLDVFETGDILLGDCYYPSYFLLSALTELGVDAVFPMHSSRHSDFRRGKKLGKHDHLVQWKKPARPSWMSQETYNSMPEVLTIREVKISDSRPGFRTKSRVLVTTLVESKNVSKDDLTLIYNSRWLVEVNFLAIKQTIQMDVLRCKSPAMIQKEIWVHLLAYNLIRKVMSQAAIKHEKIPQQLSFKLTLQSVQAFFSNNLLAQHSEFIYSQLLRAITYKVVGNRPGRSEPRVVKRRPKPFPRMQKPRSEYYRGLD